MKREEKSRPGPELTPEVTTPQQEDFEAFVAKRLLESASYSVPDPFVDLGVVD